MPGFIAQLWPGTADPRAICEPGSSPPFFEESITAIKIDRAWKSTKRNRHTLTAELIGELSARYQHPSILEIGASCGTTSLDLLSRLGGAYEQYFVTDIYFDIPYKTLHKATYFYHPLDKHCIMRVTDCCVAYEDIEDAFFPLGFIARRLFAQAPRCDPENPCRASMLHPDLKRRVHSDPRIAVKEYDISDAWPYGNVDIIKVANVLNRDYFSDEQIKTAAANLSNAVKIGGHLIITDNKDVEKISVFAKTKASKLVLEKELNGGTDVSGIIKELEQGGLPGG